MPVLHSLPHATAVSIPFFFICIMRAHYLAAILSSGSTVLAAPAPSAAAGSPPSIGSLSTLQVLNYNNLGPENNGTAAVLVHDRLDQSKAEAQCAAIGESLYPLKGDDVAQSDLEYQLDYLVYSNIFREDDLLWIAKDSSSHDCVAYSHGDKSLTPRACDSHLPAICTANVPPSTDTNRTAVETSKISVTSGEYKLTGYRDARSFRFMGVPFADPPVDDLRFAPPQPYSGSREIDATKLADSCIQSQQSFGRLGNGHISEDCLYLNVFTPILPSSKSSSHNVTRKPVVVYFHGGSFVGGTSSQIEYDGGNFASRNDVVVVTVNYRLGVLGFLTPGNTTTGSNGIRDQIQALQWVQKHIEDFGGDPSHITIFGESAGGQSVVALLSSSAAKGLFSGAVSESSPIDFPWHTREMHTKLIVPEVAKAVGCDNTQSEEALLSCFRSVPATNFTEDSAKYRNASMAYTQLTAKELDVGMFVSQIEPILPIVDDSGSGVIDDQFRELLSKQSLPNSVPTMFTTTTDEALAFSSAVPFSESTPDALDKMFNISFPPHLAKKLSRSSAYQSESNPPGAINTGLDAVTHREWSCAHAYLFRNGGHKAFPSLYQAQISQGHSMSKKTPKLCAPNQNYNATCHATDILPIWGTLNSKTQDVHPYYDQTEILHSQVLNDIFGSFFRTYNPNPDPTFLKVRGPAYAASYGVFGRDQYQVPKYSPGAEKINLLGMPPSWMENPGLSDKCAVFDDAKYGYAMSHT